MTVQTRITKIEHQLDTRFYENNRKTDKPIIFYAGVLQGEIKKGFVPDKAKITHADWDRCYADFIKRFSDDQKMMDFCFEIKKAIDDLGGWKD